VGAGPADPRLERWARDFAGRRVPVLGASLEALARLRADEDAVKPREIAHVVLRDPMLALTVLRHLRAHHSRRMLEDITTVEHAIMMLGIRRFFSAFEALPAAEAELRGQPAALAGLQQVVGRARGAAAYAGALAAMRADLVTDEVVAAALLHDLAELLLWCFAPAQAADIAARLQARPGLRSAEAQREVLGFALLDLQLALVRAWGLPELFLSLMDDAHADRPRVRNVALAVALARHAAHGWDDPALPSDIDEISRLTAQPQLEVRAQLFEAALRAVAEGGGASVSCLPPLPREPQPAGAPAPAAAALDAAAACLANIARGVARRAQPRAGLARDERHEQLAAVAAYLDGASAGLGFARALWLAPDAAGRRWQPRYAAGRAAGATAAFDEGASRAIGEALAQRAPAVHLPAGEGAAARGLFIQPVLLDGRASALAVALEPADATRLSPANFKQFRGLGDCLDRALRGLKARPPWAAPEG